MALLRNAGIYGTLLHDGRLLFGSRDNTLYCLSLDGKLVWKYTTNEFVTYGIRVVDNVVYFGSSDNNLYAVTFDKGQLLWKFKGNGMFVSPHHLTVHKGVIYIGCWDCNLYAISTEGKLLWKFRSSLATPSNILVEGSSSFKTFQTIIHQEKEEEKYRQEFLGNESGFQSQYVTKQTYIKDTRYKAGMKIKSMTSGWED